MFYSIWIFMWFLENIWWEWVLQFLGGLGFFLFGMNYLEQAVSSVTNWWFKNLLKKFTSSVLKSFWSWILITAILESSNVVSVLVLAFVWTGILSLTSALAVILGSNVWTMITSSILWIVGLSLNVSIIGLPLIFLWAIWMNFFPRWWKIEAICKFLFSFGLIFLAFSLIKDWLAFVTEIMDLTYYIDMSPRFFFWVWLLFTILVQSWTLVFIITLAMVVSWILTPEPALAIVFATYLWSTVTIVIWALWSWKAAIKKQVALWHVCFNLITSLSWILTLPLIMMVYSKYLEPNLWMVVSFTLVYFSWRALFCLIFIPLVNPISRLLKRVIRDSKNEIQLAIQKIFNVENLDPTVAQLAVKQDMLVLFRNAIKYNLNVWDFSPVWINPWETIEEELATTLSFKWNFDKNDLSKVYRDVKYIQNELLNFLVSLPVSEKSTENAELYQSVLAVVDSCKTIKDVQVHIEDWQRSSSDNLQKDYESTREMVIVFYSTILHLYQRFDSKKALSDAQQSLETLQKENDEYLAQLRPHKSDDIPLTALIQTRRYFVQSCKDLLHAMELYKATPDEIKHFKENMVNFMK